MIHTADRRCSRLARIVRATSIATIGTIQTQWWTQEIGETSNPTVPTTAAAIRRSLGHHCFAISRPVTNIASAAVTHTAVLHGCVDRRAKSPEIATFVAVLVSPTRSVSKRLLVQKRHSCAGPKRAPMAIVTPNPMAARPAAAHRRVVRQDEGRDPEAATQIPERRITSRKLRPLAVTGLRRSRAMPEVPTRAQSGVPGFDVTGWDALLAPAGPPGGSKGAVPRRVDRARLSRPFDSSGAPGGLHGGVRRGRQLGRGDSSPTSPARLTSPSQGGPGRGSRPPYS